MGLREEIAKVRMARSRLEITRAKLKKLDEEQMRLERSVGKAVAEFCHCMAAAGISQRRKGSWCS